jgi:hypothetical protein
MGGFELGSSTPGIDARSPAKDFNRRSRDDAGIALELERAA